MRHKGFHVVNVHKSLTFISDFILSHMSEKLRKRTQLYSSFKEFKEIDKMFLPKEYGGKIPMSEMIGELMWKLLRELVSVEIMSVSISDMFKKELIEKNSIFDNYNDMRVHTDMYPKQALDGSVKSLKYSLASSDIDKINISKLDIYGGNGLQGSFRKLEID